MDQMTTTRIDFLRHGLPEGENCLRGHTDFPITSQGLQQMWRAVEDLADVEKVVTSPLLRCREFAEQFAGRFSLPIEPVEHWKEMYFGHWDGQSRDILWENYGDTLSRYWQNPWLSNPHGGETLRDFDLRIQNAWQTLLSLNSGKRVLLVTHAGVMKQLLRILFDMPENARYLHRLDLPYAARYRVTVHHEDNGSQRPLLQWPVLQQF